MNKINKNFRTKIISIVEEHSSIKITENDIDKDITTELGIDSLIRVRILVSLEKKFNVDIPESDAFNLNTIRETENYLTKKTK
jgi:acyl carrier protein